MIFAPKPIKPTTPAVPTAEQPARPAAVTPTHPTVPVQPQSQAVPPETPGFEPTPPKKIDDVWFSDLYFTPEKVAYVRDGQSQFGLKVFEAPDLMDFHKALEEGFQGNSSYSLTYGTSMYRIERIKTVTGVHYTARRMPRKVPNIYELGIPELWLIN